MIRKFTEAVARKVYYGPVYFRRESEPYMTLAIAGTRRDAGVSVAEVNLKLIWDVVSQIKVGERGHAYVVDAQGRLIAHPDISLVLRNTDMSRLAQVRAARGAPATAPSRCRKAENIQGRAGAHRLCAGDAARLADVRRAADRGGLCAALRGLAAAGAGAAGGADASPCSPGCSSPAAWSARSGRCAPAPRASAAAISASGSRIKTGDELEGLADQFNDMAGRLQESYAGLERKVEERTREVQMRTSELAQSVRGAARAGRGDARR